MRQSNTKPMYARRTDATHSSIRDGLREAGFTVFDCSSIGLGFPDLLIARGGLMALVECKTRRHKGIRGRQSALDRLNGAQKTFRDEWKGPPVIVSYSLEAVLFDFHLLMKQRGFTWN